MMLFAKTKKAIAKFSEVIKIQKRVKNEGQRHGRLEDILKWQLERVKNKNQEQIHLWLGEQRLRVINEN